MLSKTFSGAIAGVDAIPVEIEVYSQVSTASFAIVGLPDAAIKEARDRIPTALKNSGFKARQEYAVTVNLAPADIRKEGPIYDLPIAIGLLKAIGLLENSKLEEYAMAGELSLSGEVRRINGILPIAMAMRAIGKKAMLVPYENRMEASVVEGMDIIPVKNLREAFCHLSGRAQIMKVHSDLADLVDSAAACQDDFADVKGQEMAVRAVEIAVAGGHNVLMIGSPGSGKTMIARRIPSILPPLTVDEALEVSKIHSIAGAAKGGLPFVTTRPFRSPHHTVSAIGLLGGGAKAVPGEVSLAHRGVLFLDEFAEFPRSVLEVMRQPLEDGKVSVARACGAHDYPSRFMLVAAMNPCPCGYHNDATHDCHCKPGRIRQYQERISGPLLDRIDIQIGVSAVPLKDLQRAKCGRSSAEIRANVVRARAIQAARYRDMPGVMTNAEVRSRDLPRVCAMDDNTQDALQGMIEKLNLSARAYDRLLKVSRTIADLNGHERVTTEDLSEAACLRQFDADREADILGY